MTSVVMPAVFVGHGSPMNALEHNRYTEAWHALGKALPRPTAIVVVSAHWYTRGTGVTAMTNPRTIHDFTGFPPELSRVQYPAVGSPEIARRVAEVLSPTQVVLDTDNWGLDHGTWSVLVHMYPDADIPVVQLSIDATLDLDEHIELGRRLEPLTHEGILVLGSGNVVHNLSKMNWHTPDACVDWAESFDNDVRTIMTTAPATLASVAAHASWNLAVPTPDHFLPLAYVAGIADAGGRTAEVFVGGGAYGTLTMTGFVT